MGPHHGGVPPVVAGRLVLFVGRVVLLVHHHQPQPVERGEHRATRPDHHSRRAVVDPPPLLEPLRFRQPAVEHRHLGPEARPKPVDDALGEGDLRHQQQRALPLFQCFPHGVEVHLRFSAARDAIEQECRVATARERPRDGIESGLLGLGQLKKRLWSHRRCPAAAFRIRLFEHLHVAVPGQGSHHGGRVRHQRPQPRQGQRPFLPNQAKRLFLAGFPEGITAPPGHGRRNLSQPRPFFPRPMRLRAEVLVMNFDCPAGFQVLLQPLPVGSGGPASLPLVGVPLAMGAKQFERLGGEAFQDFLRGRPFPEPQAGADFGAHAGGQGRLQHLTPSTKIIARDPLGEGENIPRKQHAPFRRLVNRFEALRSQCGFGFRTDHNACPKPLSERDDHPAPGNDPFRLFGRDQVIESVAERQVKRYFGDHWGAAVKKGFKTLYFNAKYCRGRLLASELKFALH